MTIFTKRNFRKLQQNILQNAPNCTTFKNFLEEACHALRHSNTPTFQ